MLVVDDDPDLRHLLGEVLLRAGYVVDTAQDGRAALRRLFETRPDVVLLDVAMPVLDGWTTLERIRELSDVPVIMLTAQGSEPERIGALRAGADDFIVKPCGHGELLARLEAVLRRFRAGRTQPPPERYEDPHVVIDFAAHVVRADGREVALTPLEFRLLEMFVRHPGQVLSADQLLETVWGDPSGMTGGRVKLYVGYLRRKLGLPTTGPPLETVRGVGYRYRPARH